MNKAAELLGRIMTQNATDAAWIHNRIREHDEAKIQRLEDEISRLWGIIDKYRAHHNVEGS